MDTGELWTRWTVRLAMMLYVGSLAMRGAPQQRRCWWDWSGYLWTAGCLAYLLHVICAFAFYHHWSHTDAYETTAKRTAETVGLHSGMGLYANYVFTLVWVADVCWWWLRNEQYALRSKVIAGAIQGFLGFMAFNATVVFATGFSRWLGVAGCLLLAGSYAYSHKPPG